MHSNGIHYYATTGFEEDEFVEKIECRMISLSIARRLGYVRNEHFIAIGSAAVFFNPHFEVGIDGNVQIHVLDGQFYLRSVKKISSDERLTLIPRIKYERPSA